MTYILYQRKAKRDVKLIESVSREYVLRLKEKLEHERKFGLMFIAQAGDLK